MSKQAGNTAVAKPKLTRLDAKQFAAEQQAKPAHKTEQQIDRENVERLLASKATREANLVAANKLKNDAFACYANVNVDELQSAAIEAAKTGEAASRKETQMQIANILARYAQDKLLGAANPVNLYTVRAGVHSFQVDCAKAITRIIYEVPEKTLDGKKNPLPQHLLARVRRIAPIVFFAITSRTPLIWDDENKVLLVPTWLAVSDPNMAKPFWEDENTRSGFNKPTPLDGKEGRTLDSVAKRIEANAVKGPVKGTNSAPSNEDVSMNKVRAAIAAAGVEKTLEALSDVFTKSPSDKPFSDAIVELLAVCCEHVNVRNGAEALGKAVAEMSSEPVKKQSAA